MRYFHVTYDIVTPESAEHGDAAERGFVQPGGWHHELKSETFGEPAGRIKDECALTLREALDLVNCGAMADGGDGDSFYEQDGREDYRTGATETRAFHISGKITDASRARIARLLTSR